MTESAPSLATLAQIREALRRTHASRDAFLEATFDLGRTLKHARDRIWANQDFGKWLAENNIRVSKGRSPRLYEKRSAGRLKP
jgi:hypothetical protein